MCLDIFHLTRSTFFGFTLRPSKTPPSAEDYLAWSRPKVFKPNHAPPHWDIRFSSYTERCSMHSYDTNSVSFWEQAFGFNASASRKDLETSERMESPGADEDSDSGIVRGVAMPISAYKPGEPMSGTRFPRQLLSPEQDNISVADRQGIERRLYHVQHSLRGPKSAHRLLVSKPKWLTLFACAVLIFRRGVHPGLEIGPAAVHKRL